MNTITIKGPLFIVALGALSGCFEANVAVQINPEGQQEIEEQNTTKVIKQMIEKNIENGDVRYTKISDYDRDGRLIQSEHLTTDTAEKLISSYAYELDEEGRVATELRYFNQNNNVDVIITYSYDDDDNLIRVVSDSLANDSYDYENEYAYEGNKLVNLTRYNSAGTVSSSDTYEYNSRGELATVGFDTDGNGNLDYDYRYEYDDSGREIKNEEFFYTTMSVGSLILCEYDASGLSKSCTFDLNNNGVFRYSEYTCNDNGQLIQRIDFGTSLDTPDSIKTYQYDAAGNMTLEDFDFDANGEVDAAFTYSYTYWD